MLRAALRPCASRSNQISMPPTLAKNRLSLSGKEPECASSRRLCKQLRLTTGDGDEDRRGELITAHPCLEHFWLYRPLISCRGGAAGIAATSTRLPVWAAPALGQGHRLRRSGVIHVEREQRVDDGGEEGALALSENLVLRLPLRRHEQPGLSSCADGGQETWRELIGACVASQDRGVAR